MFMVFAGKVFKQIIGIPIGTNCAPLLADIFLYSYGAEFIQSLLSTGRKRLSSQFSFTYRYIDDVLSNNNPDFENYLGQMYPLNLRSKTRRRATLLLPTWIYSCQSIRTVNFTTSLYDKHDDFNFHDKLSVPEHNHPIFVCLWRFHLITHPIRQGLLLL